MLHMQHHQDGLRRRLSVIGVPTYAVDPLVDLMVKWEKCSGVEWTIKRLKSLKVDLIRRRAGQPMLTWVRKNRHGDVFGVLGSLYRWSDKSERNFCRLLQAFNAYTFYIFPTLSEGQKEKFLSGINPVSTGDNLTVAFHKAFIKTITRTIRRRALSRSVQPLVLYSGSPEKRAPAFFGGRSMPQSARILDDLQLFNTDCGHHLYIKYHRIYSGLLDAVKERRQFLEWLYENHASRPDLPYTKPEIIGGEIHFLQEPGGKLRSVASPFRVHQEALKPLGLEIYDLVRELPWDCTFDQTKAFPVIQSHLSLGGQVHSVDLSSATDRFPLSLQEDVLRTILHFEDQDFVNLFIEISRGTWKSPIGNLRWTKGQPLGLFPSFGLFTLTHGLLLLHLAGGKFTNQFYVLGDDVVILDEKLHDKYIALLDRMDCPWSEDKSLSSNKLSEFAGKVVTPFGVYPQLKWRSMSDDNFLDICRLLGRRSRHLLNRRQRTVFDQVAHLCEPIGLNFSLPGDNLTKMVERTLSFYRPDEVVLGSLMGLRRKMNQMVYSSSEPLDAEELQEITATFDEKVKRALNYTVFSRWLTSVTIGLDGLSSLPEALGITPRLPLRETQPSRLTTLQKYERIIHNRRP